MLLPFCRPSLISLIFPSQSDLTASEIPQGIVMCCGYLSHHTHAQVLAEKTVSLVTVPSRIAVY